MAFVPMGSDMLFNGTSGNDSFIGGADDDLENYASQLGGATLDGGDGNDHIGGADGPPAG